MLKHRKESGSRKFRCASCAAGRDVRRSLIDRLEPKVLRDVHKDMIERSASAGGGEACWPAVRLLRLVWYQGYAV